MKNNIGLFLMNRKGHLVLESLIDNGYKEYILFVESRTDTHVANDYFKEIQELCSKHKISFFDSTIQNSLLKDCIWKITVGWRWMIEDMDNLIVIHDSLLPKYRGFAPLVNALINGENYVGVSALIATEKYDRGEIILQEKMKINYPVKISDVIEEIASLYISCVNSIFEKIVSKQEFKTYTQDESQATYSIWRDKEDYFIDWRWPASKIKRFVDALGYPYSGAKTKIDELTINILDCDIVEDIKFEIIHPGKLVYFENNSPIVMCGEGAIKINKMFHNNKEFNLNKLKTRFK